MLQKDWQSVFNKEFTVGDGGKSAWVSFSVLLPSVYIKTGGGYLQSIFYLDGCVFIINLYPLKYL